MATITKVCVGESLVGDGNEVAHIDLIIGPRGSAAETAFCNALTNNKDGFTTLARRGRAEPAGQAEHRAVQQGDDQGRQAGRADVRPRPARRRARRSRTASPTASSRRTRPTTSSSASASSSTGKRRTTRRSTTTTIAPPRRRSRAPCAGEPNACRSRCTSASRSSTRSLPPEPRLFARSSSGPGDDSGIRGCQRAVVQRGGKQRPGRARIGGRAEVVCVAHSARRVDLAFACPARDRADTPKIRPLTRAHARQRHDDDAVRPKQRIVVEFGRALECIAAKVQRQNNPWLIPQRSHQPRPTLRTRCR